MYHYKLFHILKLYYTTILSVADLSRLITETAEKKNYIKLESNQIKKNFFK